MNGTSIELLANYGWIAICAVLGGVVVYLYKQQRKDHSEVVQLYEKWIQSNKDLDKRVDEILEDYRKLAERMGSIIAIAMSKMNITEKDLKRHEEEQK